MRRRASLVLLAAASLPAQAWQVPERGALTYERTTERFTFDPPPTRMPMQWVFAGAEDEDHEWRYLSLPFGREPAGWEQPGFDDHEWAVGRGEFAPEDGQRAGVRTHWQNDVLLLRSGIDFGKKLPKALVFRIHHDDGVRVYANGKQLFADDGYGRDRYYVAAGDDLAALVPGNNVIAVRGENTGGAQCLDVAMAIMATLPAGVRSGAELEKAFRSAREAANRVRGDLCGTFRPPALLLHGELDKDRTRPVQTPGDLRELAFWAACDLTKQSIAGSYAQDLPRLLRLGDLQLRGKVSAVDASGWQDLEIAVKSAEVAAAGDSKRFLSHYVQPHLKYAIEGTLRIRRRLLHDADRTRMAECRCSLQAHLLGGADRKEQVADVVQVESFRFAQQRDGQDAQFRTEVAAAIKRGTDYLKKQLEDLRKPSLRPQDDEARRSYHSGRIAIALLAMIKGGVPRDDPVLVAALDELRRRNLVDTYSLGNALMALEAFHSPSNYLTDIQSGRLERAVPHTLDGDDKELMQRWTTLLLDNVDTRIDPVYGMRFNYVRDARFDHSVNQYGLLGLYSAHLCGIEISPSLWEGAANHLIAAQSSPGPALQLDLTDFRTLARMATEPQAARGATVIQVRPAGWNYQEPKDQGEDRPVWGSMTCAGINGLAIAQAALQDSGAKRIKLQNEATAARNAGFAWLAQHMTVRYHPGSIEHQHHWFFYYLYGLERAALLSNIALIQGRDWYFEGAMVLIGTQDPDGSWPPELMADQEIERAAMAVLFLAKGTRPVLTGG